METIIRSNRGMSITVKKITILSYIELLYNETCPENYLYPETTLLLRFHLG